MRATEIARLLATNVDGVVRHLLPKGRRKGAEWEVGDLSGESGESLRVHLTGDKAGVWADFSTGESGDLVGLWMAVRGLSLRDACTEAMAYLGIREDKLDPPRRSYAKPSREGVAPLSPEHRAWLLDERRIAVESVRAYRLASRNGGIMFPYLRDGELIAAKYRGLPKKFWQDNDCEPCLFGWQAIPDNARQVVIAEGEMDALAWHTYGVPALSVPMGGGTGNKQLGWIQSEFERLSLYDEILLSLDPDKAGQDAQREIVERLGRERCRIVTLPHKDANECLMRGVPREDMQAAVRDARSLDPSELKDAGEFEDAVWQEYTKVDQGIQLPWKKTWDDLRLRPGETSIWAGINGHGKSAVVSHVVADQATRGVRCCVASMEYRPARWLMRMNRLISGVEQPSEAFARHIMRKLRGNLFVFDVVGKAKSERILEVIRYARRRYRIELFVIDNLTKCGFDDDDYSGQKLFVEQLADLARSENTHVAIVAHMRKTESEDKPTGKMGVKGSGGIADMADTVLEVWRNKPRERAIEQAARDHTEVPEKHRDAPDTLLLCHKQRDTGKEPRIGLWFDERTTQFLSNPDHNPRPLVQFSAVENVA